MSLAMAAGVSSIFPTPASRLEVDSIIGAIPGAMVNLFGRPEKLGTLGGYFSWKYGAIFALGTALWSIMALSGTLAGEAGRGSWTWSPRRRSASGGSRSRSSPPTSRSLA